MTSPPGNVQCQPSPVHVSSGQLSTLTTITPECIYNARSMLTTQQHVSNTDMHTVSKGEVMPSRTSWCPCNFAAHEFAVSRLVILRSSLHMVLTHVQLSAGHQKAERQTPQQACCHHIL